MELLAPRSIPTPQRLSGSLPFLLELDASSFHPPFRHSTAQHPSIGSLSNLGASAHSQASKLKLSMATFGLRLCTEKALHYMLCILLV